MYQINAADSRPLVNPYSVFVLVVEYAQPPQNGCARRTDLFFSNPGIKWAMATLISLVPAIANGMSASKYPLLVIDLGRYYMHKSPNETLTLKIECQDQDNQPLIAFYNNFSFNFNPNGVPTDTASQFKYTAKYPLTITLNHHNFQQSFFMIFYTRNTNFKLTITDKMDDRTIFSNIEINPKNSSTTPFTCQNSDASAERFFHLDTSSNYPTHISPGSNLGYLTPSFY